MWAILIENQLINVNLEHVKIVSSWLPHRIHVHLSNLQSLQMCLVKCIIKMEHKIKLCQPSEQ